MKETNTKKDIYREVTQSIIESLEQGTKPWARPWVDANKLGVVGLPERSDGALYRGINVLMLWSAANKNGYLSSKWMTYRQAQALGGNVRKGERSSRVVYANTIPKEDEMQDGTKEKKEIFYMKGYSVFNAEQIDGLSDDYYTVPSISYNPDEHIGRAELFFARLGADVRHGGNDAFYDPTHDYIQIPRFEAFTSAEAHAGVLAHELIHWTAHETRLARNLTPHTNQERYAFEELIAEIGAAFLCARLAITPQIQDGQASYIAHWIDTLKQDNRYIFRAASRAQKACDYLLSLGKFKGEKLR